MSCCKRATCRMVWSRTKGSSGGLLRRVSRACLYIWADNNGRAICWFLQKVATLMTCLQMFPSLDQEQSQRENSEPGFQIVYTKFLSVWDNTLARRRFCSSSTTSTSGIWRAWYQALVEKELSRRFSKYPVSKLYCSSQYNEWNSVVKVWISVLSDRIPLQHVARELSQGAILCH
jgi:hypothetical protein